MAATKPRSVRVADELWKAATDEAAANFETVSDVITRALVAYTAARRASTPAEVRAADIAERERSLAAWMAKAGPLPVAATEANHADYRATGPCPRCSGSGGLDITGRSHRRTCPDCGGYGTLPFH